MLRLELNVKLVVAATVPVFNTRFPPPRFVSAPKITVLRLLTDKLPVNGLAPFKFTVPPPVTVTPLAPEIMPLMVNTPFGTTLTVGVVFNNSGRPMVCSVTTWLLVMFPLRPISLPPRKKNPAGLLKVKLAKAVSAVKLLVVEVLRVPPKNKESPALGMIPPDQLPGVFQKRSWPPPVQVSFAAPAGAAVPNR